MWKRVVLVVSIVLLIALNIIQFFGYRSSVARLHAQYDVTIATLQQTIQKWGDQEITVYTVNKTVKAGDEIKDEDLKAMTIPSPVDSDQYIHDTMQVVGNYYKIAIQPGTIITNNMTMDYILSDDVRDVDIKLDAYTGGLKPGDYIDIYFTAPYGDRYLVLPKVRIMNIATNQLLKVYLTAEQRHTLAGAYIDLYLNKAYGAALTGEKYVEPGLQAEAIQFYSVPNNILQVMNQDPNIANDALSSINDTKAFRDFITEALDIFRDTEDTIDSDAEKLAEGRSELLGAINEVTSTEAEEAAEAAKEQSANEGYDEEDDMWGDDGTEDVGAADTGTADTGTGLTEDQVTAGDDTTAVVDEGVTP